MASGANQLRFAHIYLLTLYNKVSFANINVLTNMNKQWTMHLLHYLLIFVNVNENSCSFLIHVSSQCIN